MNNKNFTLIELIVVIAILGILVSLIVPNISSFKGDATVTAITNNVRNFQTSVDMYSLKNHGEYPTIEQPTEFIPQPIDFTKLDKKYLKTLPKTEGVKYWVDFQGRIWASTVDAPQGVTNTGGTITWKPVTGAIKYQIFELQGYQGFIGTLTPSKTNLVFKGETTDTIYSGEEDKYYVINTIDKQNFQSAPAGLNYEGYVNPTQPQSTTTPTNHNPVVIITMNPEDNLKNTTNITFDYTFTDEDNDTISKVEWQLDANPIQPTAPNGMLNGGSHTVKVRIQDTKGEWSAWAEKTFIVVEPLFMYPDKVASLFDKNLNTGFAFGCYSGDTTGTTDITVTIGSGLTNKVVSITAEGLGLYGDSGGKVQILDANALPLTFITTSDVVGTSVRFPKGAGKITYNIVIPKDAKYLKFTHIPYINGWDGIKIYEIQETTDLTDINSVSNISAISTDISTTLTWTNPIDSNLDKVSIYRDGAFVGYSTTGTYTVKPLMSDTEYTYTLYSISKTGNRSDGVSYKARTIRPEIVWKGPSATMFDRDLATGYDFGDWGAVNNVGQALVTWEGDLTNKVVSVTVRGLGRYDGDGGKIQILDQNNQPIEFTLSGSSTVYTVLKYHKPTGTVTNNIVIPANAKTIKFAMFDSSDRMIVYDVRAITGNTYMVGEQVSSPEPTWQRLEETTTNINYTGTWTNGIGSYYTNGNGKSTTDPNAKVQFKFYGSKLRIISNRYTNKPNNIRISIDGQPYEIFSQYATDGVPVNSYYILTYEKKGLTLDTHTVEVFYPDLISGQNWNFDAIDIDSAGYLVP